MILYIAEAAFGSKYIVPAWRNFLKYLCEKSDELAIEDIQLKILRENDHPIKGSHFLTIGTNGFTRQVKSHCKIISLWDDIHYFDEASLTRRKKFFSFVDILLLTYPEHFTEYIQYNEWVEKIRPFRWFSAFPSNQIASSTWKDRSNDILLSGRISETYPLRQKLRDQLGPDYLRILEHPGYGDAQRADAVLGLDYYKLLAGVKSAIATSAAESNGHRVDYLVAKYFEIPAAGALLVCEKNRFLERAGFIDGVNCVVIDEKRLTEFFKDLQRNIFNYQKIAEAGTQLVETQHSMHRRMQQLVEILCST